MEQFDDFTVDPETGEIIDCGVARDTITEDLPRIARALRSIERQVEDNTNNGTIEVERILAFVEVKNKPLENQIAFLRSKAEQLMQAANMEKVDYAGLGKFKYQTGREKIQTKGWDEADYETQVSLAMAYNGLFRTKQTISPDKKAIKETIQGGSAPDKIAELFSVFKPEPTFVFKRED